MSNSEDELLTARGAVGAGIPAPAVAAAAAPAIAPVAGISAAGEVVPAPPVQFSLTPGLYDIATSIDYGTRTGALLYQIMVSQMELLSLLSVYLTVRLGWDGTIQEPT